MSDGVGASVKDCREEFKPTAARRRAMSRLLGLVMLPALGFWLLLWTERDRQVGGIGFVVCWAIMFIGSLLLPKIVCPACHHKADHEIDHFCPECGSAAVDRSYGFFSIERCTACGKKLWRGKGGRRYKIRFCTVCGAHLDDTGV